MTDDESPDAALGDWTLETETLPDGRTIRYYAWPYDSPGEDTTAPPPPEAP